MKLEPATEEAARKVRAAFNTNVAPMFPAYRCPTCQDLFFTILDAAFCCTARRPCGNGACEKSAGHTTNCRFPVGKPNQTCT